MKVRLTKTLFLPLAGFLALAAPAAASEFEASFISCSANPFTIPAAIPAPGQPAPNAPVGLVGGDSHAGGTMYAGGEVHGGMYAQAVAPNALVGTFNSCGINPRATHDVTIQGPAGQPDPIVTVHLPIHANFHQNWAEVFDLPLNSPFSSSNLGAITFTANLGGRAQAQIVVQLNREGQVADVSANPFQTRGTLQLVPLPRDPNAAAIDPNGFIRLFFRNVLPIGGGGPNDPIVGVDFTEIDELRGEIILTAAMPANTPLTLRLDMNASTTANSAVVVGASSFISEARMSLPTDGTVAFELPAGYTVNAPSLGLVNGSVVPQIFKCPVTSARWRTTPGAWPVQFLTLGARIYSQNELLTLLQTPAGALRPDASLALAQQLIGARLNEENGASPGPMLQAAAAADALFAGLAGALPYHVDPRSQAGQQMMNLAQTLSRYNAGQLTPPQCAP